MTSISVSDIKKLREKTGAGVMDAKKALQECYGDMKKAEQWVQEKGIARAEKKSDRETKEGYIASYVHTTGKIAALVEVQCETDFVARNQEFRSLAQDLAMQVASMNPESVEKLLLQDFIKDGSKTIDQLVKALSGKIGEKFVVNKFTRFQVGE
jgi:elongation factor Ts